LKPTSHECDVEGLAPSTRARFHIVLRSVLRTAVNAGLLAAMPALPKLPKSGRKAVNPMRRGDLDAILAAASPSARLAFELAAFAGLRAGEVRGLRWPDVDLDAGTLTIRRSISAGFETTPKSHHQRRIPMSRTLRAPLAEARPSKQGQSLGGRDHHGAREAVGPRAGSTKRSSAPWSAGLDGCWSSYDLRHFFVSELFRMGASAEAIRIMAGHADLGTTQRYADLDANDLRAFERIDGKALDGRNADRPTER
jgi:integrase